MVNDILEGLSGSLNANAATLARVWHMDSPDRNSEELLKNKAYFKQLFNLLRSSQDEEGYFITDIVTLVDITEAWWRKGDSYTLTNLIQCNSYSLFMSKLVLVHLSACLTKIFSATSNYHVTDILPTMREIVSAFHDN
jgi:hypothetical protein